MRKIGFINKGVSALAGAFMLASAGMSMPVSAQQSDAGTQQLSAVQQAESEALEFIKKDIHDIVNASLDSSSRYVYFDQIEYYVREHPELAEYAMIELARVFDYRPIASWDNAITTIQNLAAGDRERSMLAYQLMATPMNLALRTFAEDNLSMQQDAFRAQYEIAHRMHYYRKYVVDGWIAFLENEDPHARALVEDIAESLSYFSEDDPELARKVFLPIQNNLDNLMDEYLDIKSIENRSYRENSNLTALSRQIDEVISPYVRTAIAAGDDYTQNAFFNLTAMYPEFRPDDSTSVFYAICNIGSRNESMTRDVIDTILDYTNENRLRRISCLRDIAKHQEAFAEEAVGHIGDLITEDVTHDTYYLTNQLDALASEQPAAIPYVIEALIGFTAEQLTYTGTDSLTSLAAKHDQYIPAVIQKFIDLADADVKAFMDTRPLRGVVEMARAHPIYKESVLDLLNMTKESMIAGATTSEDFEKISKVVEHIAAVEALEQAEPAVRPDSQQGLILRP